MPSEGGWYVQLGRNHRDRDRWRSPLDARGGGRPRRGDGPRAVGVRHPAVGAGDPRPGSAAHRTGRAGSAPMGPGRPRAADLLRCGAGEPPLGRAQARLDRVLAAVPAARAPRRRGGGTSRWARGPDAGRDGALCGHRRPPQPSSPVRRAAARPGSAVRGERRRRHDRGPVGRTRTGHRAGPSCRPRRDVRRGQPRPPCRVGGVDRADADARQRGCRGRGRRGPGPSRVGRPLRRGGAVGGGDPGDGPRGHLRAGIALQRTWLAATDSGLAASAITRPPHLRDVRSELVEATGRTGFPQAVLRVGVPAVMVLPTPSRSLAALSRTSGKVR